MRRDLIRLSQIHRLTVYAILAAVFMTGGAWAALHYLLPRGDELGSSTAESWMLKLHGAAAMATLVVVGTLLPVHVKSAWRVRRNRKNGVTLLGLVALLTVSGYGLYYIGNDAFRSLTSWVHLAIGLLLPFLFVLHLWRGRATRPNVARRRQEANP